MTYNSSLTKWFTLSVFIFLQIVFIFTFVYLFRIYSVYGYILPFLISLIGCVAITHKKKIMSSSIYYF